LFTVTTGTHQIFFSQESSRSSSTNNVNTTQQDGGGVKTAKVVFPFEATNAQELTINRGEHVEVLDDSRKWWRVKNRVGGHGYVPSNMLELLPSKKQSRDNTAARRQGEGKLPIKYTVGYKSSKIL